jgi:beta-1,4-galactosyltransferase 1
LKYPIKLGGKSKPDNCVSRQKIAIVIPYRNREDSLNMLLNSLHTLLNRQKIDYGIYAIEPFDNITFNRGLLMNIGYLEALEDIKNDNQTNRNYDCFIFHDVDLIPENERNIYHCSETLPMHMSSAVSTMKYK